MFFEDEPAWMKKARTIPLRSTWDSRNPSRKQAEVQPLPRRTDRVVQPMK